MQGVLDILGSDITVVGESDFIADGAVTDIAVNSVGVNGLAFSNAFGGSYFALGENMLIRKLWATVSWGFGPGGPAIAGAHNIGLGYWDGAVFQVIPCFPYASRSIDIPQLCEPLDFGDGIYAVMPTTGVKRQIRLVNIDARISQINLPAQLQGVRIKVQYFLEVLHTFPLTLVP